VNIDQCWAMVMWAYWTDLCHIDLLFGCNTPDMALMVHLCSARSWVRTCTLLPLQVAMHLRAVDGCCRLLLANWHINVDVRSLTCRCSFQRRYCCRVVWTVSQWNASVAYFIEKQSCLKFTDRQDSHRRWSLTWPNHGKVSQSTLGLITGQRY